MSDVFISYSRRDIAFAQLLHRALEENGLETWIDWQDIPPSIDWLAEVYAAIEATDSFVFIISETSVGSEICGHEIEHALKNHKRLIPIVIEEVEAGKVHQAVRGLNWIFFGEQGEAFHKAALALNIAIKTDYEWVKAHTRLQTRALEWDRNQREGGYLLGGADLRGAEDWLSRALGKDPQPTTLQAEYIRTSRAAVTRRRRITLAGVAVAILVALGLGWLAMQQRAAAVQEGQVRATAQAEAALEAEARATAQAVAEIEAVQRATAQAEAALEAEARATAQLEAAQKGDLAFARQVASNALNLLAENLDLSLLLSVEALRIADTLETRSSLLQGLMYTPKIERFLPSQAIPPRYQEIYPQTFRCAFHPDGRQVACSDANGTILVWDVASGERMTLLADGGEAAVTALAFSPDESTLASGDADRVVRLWDTETWEQLGAPLSGPESRLCEKCAVNMYGINSLTFRRDGRELAAGCANGDIMRWELATGDLITLHYGVLNLETNTDQATAFTPDGARMAVTHVDPIVYIYDVESGHELARSATLPVGSIPDALRFSPDGKWLAVAGGTRVVLLDADTLEVIKGPLEDHTQGVRSLSFSPDGKVLATGGIDQTILLWEVESEETMAPPLRGHTDWVVSLAFSPDGSRLVSTDQENHFLLWDVTDRPGPMGAWIPVEGGVHDLAYQGETGRLIIDSEFEPLVYQLEFSMQPEAPTQVLLEDVDEATLSADGDWVVWGGEQYSAYLWHIPETRQVGPVPLCWSETLAFSPQSGVLAVGNINSQGTWPAVAVVGKFSLCDVTTGLPQGVPVGNFEGRINILQFNPDGNLLAGGSFDGEVFLWDMGGFPPVERVLSTAVAYEDDVDDLAFSADGALLAASRRYITVWQVEPQTLLWPALFSPGGDCSGVAISPDGKILAGACGEGENWIGSISLWDLESGQLIGTPLTGSGGMRAILFSPDGRLLFSGNNQGLDIWQMEVEAWMEAACRIANRNLSQEEWSTYLPGRPYQETCPVLP